MQHNAFQKGFQGHSLKNLQKGQLQQNVFKKRLQWWAFKNFADDQRIKQFDFSENFYIFLASAKNFKVQICTNELVHKSCVMVPKRLS